MGIETNCLDEKINLYYPFQRGYVTETINFGISIEQGKKIQLELGKFCCYCTKYCGITENKLLAFRAAFQHQAKTTDLLDTSIPKT